MSARKKSSQSESQGDPLQSLTAALTKASSDERSLILLAHGILELFSNALIDARCKHAKVISSDSRGYPHSVRLIILNETNIINDREFKRLDWFRKLRNRAAHDPLFALAPSDTADLHERYSGADGFRKFCTHFVMGVWNDHVDDLLPRFSPSLIDAHNADLKRRGRLPNIRMQPTRRGSAPAARG